MKDRETEERRTEEKKKCVSYFAFVLRFVCSCNSCRLVRSPDPRPCRPVGVDRAEKCRSGPPQPSYSAMLSNFQEIVRQRIGNISIFQTERRRRQRASVGKISENVARFRLYRHRFSQVNTRFAAFFKIYKIIKLTFLTISKILQILRHLQIFADFSQKLLISQTDFLRKF